MVDMMTRMWECVFVLHVWEALEMLESAVRKSAKKFGNLHGFHDGGDVGVRVHSEVLSDSVISLSSTINAT